MDSIQISNVQLSSTVAASTLRENVLTELERNPNPDWGYLLKHLTTSFRQLETTRNDVHPSFELYDVVPQNPAVMGIPEMLGTSVSSGDAALLSHDRHRDKYTRSEVLTAEDVDRHNRNVQSILESLGSIEESSLKQRR